MGKGETIFVKILEIFPFWSRLYVFQGFIGLILGLIIAIFTSWIAIPITIIVFMVAFNIAGIFGFWGWLYGKSEGL